MGGGFGECLWKQERQARSWHSGMDLGCKCAQKANGLKPLIGRERRKDMKRRHDATSILVNCIKKRMFCATLSVKEIGARKERETLMSNRVETDMMQTCQDLFFSLKSVKPYSHPSIYLGTSMVIYHVKFICYICLYHV